MNNHHDDALTPVQDSGNASQSSSKAATPRGRRAARCMPAADAQPLCTETPPTVLRLYSNRICSIVRTPVCVSQTRQVSQLRWRLTGFGHEREGCPRCAALVAVPAGLKSVPQLPFQAAGVPETILMGCFSFCITDGSCYRSCSELFRSQPRRQGRKFKRRPPAEPSGTPVQAIHFITSRETTSTADPDL